MAERTAQSDLPLEGPRAAMELQYVVLSLAIDPERRSIAGEGSYRVLLSEPQSTLAFDLDPRFTVSAISVNGAALDRGAWRNPDGLLTMQLPAAAGAGDVLEVSISYAGRPHEALSAPWEGGFVWSQANGQPWIATAVQGEGCDLFWPCIDHSSSRIGAMETLVTVPAGLVAAGNGALLATVENDDNTTTFHWRARNPSNYGISLQIGPFELSERMYESRYGNSIPIQFWHLPENKAGARRLIAEMVDYLDFFESTIGPYPFGDEKAGVVETPHLGMEHQTINAYGNQYRRDELGYDWLLHHEFAHEWFANQLTHANINHMWLHEGIGTWMQPLYLGWARGEMFYNAEMWRQRQSIISRVPLVPPEGTMPDYNDRAAGWGTDIYAKGAWIMHSLRYLVGDDVLFPALQELTYGTNNPVPGEIAPVLRTTDDFRQILEARTGYPLDWFFDTYFYQAELPRLRSRREGDVLTLEWEAPSDSGFDMPVELRFGGTTRRIAMDGGSATVTLPEGTRHVQIDPRNQILMYDEAIAAARGT
ncbi:M1 family metallopeptidase [Erythrobacter alti]|uniref:M1 family metallopeptidase n=1 Tax=Erythrobacter alti TaxID=1896145 RepID=UPI0030F47790